MSKGRGLCHACSVESEQGQVRLEKAFMGQGAGPWNPMPLVLLLFGSEGDGNDLGLRWLTGERTTLLNNGCAHNRDGAGLG